MNWRMGRPCTAPSWTLSWHRSCADFTSNSTVDSPSRRFPLPSSCLFHGHYLRSEPFHSVERFVLPGLHLRNCHYRHRARILLGFRRPSPHRSNILSGLRPDHLSRPEWCLPLRLMKLASLFVVSCRHVASSDVIASTSLLASRLQTYFVSVASA